MISASLVRQLCSCCLSGHRATAPGEQPKYSRVSTARRMFTKLPRSIVSLRLAALLQGAHVFRRWRPAIAAQDSLLQGPGYYMKRAWMPGMNVKHQVYTEQAHRRRYC